MQNSLRAEEIAVLREAWNTRGKKLSAAHRAAISSVTKHGNTLQRAAGTTALKKK